MRVTNSILYRTVKRNIQRSSSDVNKYQEQITSGKRINRPSDDPLGAMRSQQLYTKLNKIGQYSRNQTYAKSWLSMTESVLTQSSDLMVRLKEIAIAQASGNSNAETREIAAEEVQTIRDQLLSLANTKVGNRSVFAGHQTNGEAFLNNGQYAGDEGEILLNINDGITVQVNKLGDDVFAAGAGKTVFESLSEFVTALQGNDQTEIQSKIDELDLSFDSINRSLSSVGAIQNQVDNVENIAEENEIRHKDELGQVEEVDIVEAVIGLETAQNAFQAALSSAKTISQMNLTQML